MPVLEKEIEGQVVAWAKKHGFLTPKVKFADSGYPDRLFISPYGHTIFIEFKRPGEHPDPIQNYRIAELHRRNIPACWTDSSLEGIRVLQAALEPSSIPGKSDKADVVPIGGGALSRSGPRENQRRAGLFKDSIRQAIDSARANSRASASNAEDLAGRGQQVDGLRRDDVLPPPSSTDTGSDESTSPHPSDKPGGN